MSDEKIKSLMKDLGLKALKGVEKATPYIVVGRLYKKIFYKRTETDPFLMFHYEDYPGLIREDSSFTSNHYQRLQGYFYHYKNYDQNKVIIFAHGYGNGHARYLDLIEYLCRNGFLVYSYDVTSFDESEGEGIDSFPQAIIDLSFAIKHIKGEARTKNSNIYLVGHSMGGYAVGCNLNIYHDIDKAVILSGFNQSGELIKAQGEKWAGESAPDFVKYVDSYEKYFYPNYYQMTVVDGLKNSKNTKAIFVHSKDDNTVLYDQSMGQYIKNFKDDKRVELITYKNRGHGTIYYSDKGRKYFEEQHKLYKKYCKSAGNITKLDKINYLDEHLDKKIWLDMLDHNLLDDIINFLKK